jgi:hypothetical protein
VPKDEIDKHLFLGLIPNFILMKSDKINFEDFSIEKIDWITFKNVFPDINLNQFVEYKYIKDPYFIVFGEINDAPNKKILGLSFEFLTTGLDYFEKVILLLNLFKCGSVPVFTSTGFFRWTTENLQYSAKHISANINMEKHIDWGEQCVNQSYWLTGDELKELIRFKKHVYPLLLKEKPSPNEKYIQIAMEYYLEGCLKEANDDDEMAALDFIIGLEALYLTKDPQELKYRFANRVAVFLSNEPERKDERRELQKYAQHVYDLRSDIVHGTLSRKDILKKLTSTTGKQIGGNVYSIRELLRASIIYFLSLHLNGLTKKQDILEKIDLALLSKDDRVSLMMMKRRLFIK